MEETQLQQRPSMGKRVRRFFRISWLIIERLFDISLDKLGEYVTVLRREPELFIGIGLALAGLLNFQNGKNCDGNTADYLSCTRPSTFYYYSWVEITIIVIGVFLVLFWYLKLPRRESE
jgi:hypothetical protein